MASILFLSQSLPFPPDSGGKQRTFHVLQELERSFDVTLVAFARREHQPDGSARLTAESELGDRLSRVLPSVRFPLEWSRTRLLWDHGRSLLTGTAYSRFQYGVPEFGRQLDEALAKATPDLVHFDSIDFFSWLAHFRGIPVTCTHHDIESHLLERRAQSAGNPLVSRYIKRQAQLVRKVEAGYCPHFDVNLTMSEVDSRRLAEIAPSAQIMEAPNAVDLERFPLPRDPGDPDTVVFVGPTYLFANEDAARFLLEDIWPRVRERRPRARLLMVGKNTPEQRERYAAVPGVEPLGWVERIQDPVGRAACSVIPIRVGGGTRIKILESWALGRSIVTTSVGGEGLRVEDGRNALVRDDAQSFADAIVGLLEDAELRHRLGTAGRRTVERHYDWRSVGRKVAARYERIIEGARRRPQPAPTVPAGAPWRPTDRRRREAHHRLR